jgi:hypothetical protein
MTGWVPAASRRFEKQDLAVQFLDPEAALPTGGRAVSYATDRAGPGQMLTLDARYTAS